MNTSDSKDIDEADVFFGRNGSAESRKIVFHVPGHIGVRFFDDSDCCRLIRTDTTELSWTDDLHNPEGPIKNSLETAASIFGSAYSFYLCSGTTTGIRIMLSAVLDESSVLLLPRSVHLSVVWTLGIIGCHYSFLPVRLRENNILSPLGMPDPMDMDDYLAGHPEVTDVFVTSPDYYGRCAKLSALARVAHKHQCRLLVDEAHGAHFVFGGNSFPESAMRAGADISVSSLHKTLPALTPAAIIHVSADADRFGRVQKSRITHSLNVFESSSPSFMIAASSHLAIERMKRSGPEPFEKCAERVQRLSTELDGLPGVRTTDPLDQHEKDPLRMTLNITGTGSFASEVCEALERKGIYAEFSDPVRLLFIFSVLHEEREFLALSNALKEILTISGPDRTGESLEPERLDRHLTDSYTRIPEAVVPLRKAIFGRHISREISLSECAGTVSAATVALYPPGIPVIWPGERVSRETGKLLLNASEVGIALKGLTNGLFGELVV